MKASYVSILFHKLSEWSKVERCVDILCTAKNYSIRSPTAFLVLKFPSVLG